MGEYHICLFDVVAGGLPMRSSFDFFFFSFLRKYRIYQIGITPRVVPILDFRDFYIFKKYFRKNAEQTEKASAPQWKEDSTYVCLVLQLGRV